ncbi:integrase catalytic domain-containing protein [Trichonephila clavipes]|nr:integrase catalytic domain-containing protein [Trichonephila clavipes]
MQTVSIAEESNCQLLCSKSRVAPTKLMTQALLSKLTRKVISALKMQIESNQLWSDSTIALAWINTPPNQLKTVVGNRVLQIQQLVIQGFPVEACLIRGQPSRCPFSCIGCKGTCS